MVSIYTADEVDFMFLTTRIKKAESRKLPQLTTNQLKNLVSKGVITEQESNFYLRKISIQNRLCDWKEMYSITYTETQQHCLGPFFEKGMMFNEGYKLMSFDLASLIIEIICQISDIDYDVTDWDLNPMGKKLGKFLSNEMKTDDEVQSMVATLYALECPPLTAYLNKAIDTANSSKVIIRDLYGAERTYSKLSPIEAIIAPIALSLNALTYAFAENLADGFRRGSKRFACLNHHSLYYFVREDKVNDFLKVKLSINGRSTNLKSKLIDYPFNQLLEVVQ